MNMITPQIWSNPQNIVAYTRAAGRDMLNIIPPSTLEGRFTTFPSRLGSTHYIQDTEILREILIKRPRDFPKARSISVLLRPAIPHSIFIAEGEDWQEQHKQMVEIFDLRHVRARAEAMAQTTSDYLRSHPFDQVTGDITTYLQDLTFTVISQIILGRDSHPLFAELRVLVDDYILRGTRPSILDIPALKLERFPNIRNLTMRRNIHRIFKICDQIIDERMAEPPSEAGDFLEHLLGALDYRAQPSLAKKLRIRDNLTTFLVAGHETTAMALSWACYVVGFYPSYQEAIAAETTAPAFERPRTEAFVKEVMRLFPPAALTARISVQDEAFDGLNLRRGEGIIVPIIALHRHRAYWDNPDHFDPERFLDFKPKPLSYMPFGAGPRVCIGQSLSMLEMRLILPAILAEIFITPVDHRPQPFVALTLRSRNGIRIGMRRRNP